VSHNVVSEWDFLYNKAHNEFLNFLATTGIVGLGSYVLLLGAFFYQLRAVLNLKTNISVSDRLLALGLLSGIAALSVSNFFGFSTVMVTVLLYLYFAWVVILLNKIQTPALENSLTAKTNADTSIYIGLGSIGLGCIYALFIINTWWRADHLYSQGKQYIRSGLLSDGLGMIEQAIRISPQEPLFYDELASTYAPLAVELQKQGEATAAAQLAAASLQASDVSLKLNPRQLNFYRTRARALITLAQLDEQYLTAARQTLQTALDLAPTDAKIMYNLAVVEISSGQASTGYNRLQETIRIKPNYAVARRDFADYLVTQGKLPEALQEVKYILENISPGDPIITEKKEIIEASISAQTRNEN
jgi:putative inorganic carbon (HCO3(-)) transporter